MHAVGPPKSARSDEPSSRGDRGTDGSGERRGGANGPDGSAGLNGEEGELVDYGVVLDGRSDHISRLELVSALSWSCENLVIKIRTRG
jgi:hypothetical protein